MTSGQSVPPYRGPQFAGPDFAGPPPSYTPVPGPTDEQLRRLPPPPVAPWPVAPPPRPLEQRPAVVALATTLAVTASLLWVCALSLGWLVAVAGTDALDRSGSDGVAFHLLDGFTARLLDGLWVPLYLFPLTSLVTGFLLLLRRPWAPVLHTAVGLLALAWSAWWLRDALGQWMTLVVYVGVAVAVLWTPAARRWYRSSGQRGTSATVSAADLPR
jgi:hypothetical protein